MSSSAIGFGADRFGWTDDALAELRRLRGWTEAAIERLELTYDERTGAVGIPIRDLDDELGTITYNPWPNRRANGRSKMTQPAGVPRQLFPPPELLPDGTRDVLLVEGEPDAIAAWSAGLAAVGVPGTAGWQPEYAARFRGPRWTVYVVYDCDAPGRRAGAEVAGSLVELGVDARLVDLEPARSDGYDLTDYLLERGPGALRELMAASELYSTGPPPLALNIETLETFAATDEPGARELVGEPGQALIPAGGNVMLYGDGGAGKTTLSVDLACHLGAGDDWIGITIATIARSLIVEDEGPRPFFRRKLERKLESWTGSPINGRVFVVADPWAAFTFAEEMHRIALARSIDELELDVVIVGPVVVAGMERAGTLQDVRAFLALVNEVRNRTRRRVVTFVLVHHENKGGEVSGAWEGAGDTLLHLNAQGHGKTRLHVQKARQAPDYHLKTFVLAWADGEGYTVEEGDAKLDDDTIEGQILAIVDLEPGIRWTVIEGRTKGIGDDRRRGIRDRLLNAGTIVNRTKAAGGDVLLAYCEPRKATSLYMATDPEIRHLLPARRRGEPLDDELF